MNENLSDLCTALQSNFPEFVKTHLFVVNADNVGAIIACLALLLTIRQIKLTHKHNKLSVCPNLVIHTVVNRVPINEISRFQIELVLLNNGIGPARIKKISAQKGCDEFSNLNLEETIKEFSDDIQEKFKDKEFGHSTISVKVLGAPYVIRANEQIILGSISLSPCHDNAAEEFIKLFKELGIKIKYESFYEDEYEATY